MKNAVLRTYVERAAPSALPEKMDGETDYATFRDTVESLASVNRLTAGYRPLQIFLDRVLTEVMRPETPGPLRVLDVGFGYGDGTRAVADHLAAAGIPAEVVGVDLNPHAKAAAEAATRDYDGVTIAYITADVFDHVKSAPPYDLIVSALFTHHLEDAEVVAFLEWMDDNARLGWLINDLYRSRFAAAGFGALATLLQRHPYVRHDGPVSFARSFRRADWTRFLAQAGVDDAYLFLGAPFRLCVAKHG